MTHRLPLSFALIALCAASACAPLAIGGAARGGVAVAEERTFGTAVDDTSIHGKIWNRYLQSDTKDLYSNIGIVVHEGRVLLTGPVETPEQAAKAVQLAWDVDGVKEVINEIQITENATPANYPRDAWITGQVKARLLAEKDVRSVNYTIETVNNVVYVMGIAQSEDELARVLNVVSRVKGVRKVVSHVRLRSDVRRTDAAATAQGADVPAQESTAPLAPQTGYDQPDYTQPQYGAGDSSYGDSYGGADTTFTPQY